MSLNLGSARTYHAGRQYYVEAARAIQRQLGMASQSGTFDDATIRAVSEWQGSTDRKKPLVPDGKLGPNSLGCMLVVDALNGGRRATEKRWSRSGDYTFTR